MLALLLVSAACSAGSALIVTQPGNVSSARLDASQITTNPAGCVEKRTSSTLEELGGVYPVEEFKDMLATRTGTLWRNNQKDFALSDKLKVPWCPAPSSDSPFTSEDSEGFRYLEQQLAGITESDPVILVVAELHSSSGDYHVVQTTNFLCGLQRLGLAQYAAVFVMSESTRMLLSQQFPSITILQHQTLMNTISRIGLRTGVNYANRIAKLVLASMLVEKGREVLVTDLDMYWSQNPIDYLRALRTPEGHEVEFAAMKDCCWLELNSGFLYYKSTAQTKELLRTALSTKKFSGIYDGLRADLLSDNDQYLLNCALALSATKGMRYVVVPREKFLFGGPGRCHDESEPAPEAPLVWHTAGFSTDYSRELETFVLTGLLDLDSHTGRCLADMRGSAGAMADYEKRWSRMCRSGADGVGAPLCYGNCAAAAPTRVEDLLSQYKAGWKIQAASQWSRHSARDLHAEQEDFSDSDRSLPSQ